MILCKFGNDKAGEDTLLFNMGSATRCPARERCRVLGAGRNCYPARVESRHPVVQAFRDRQERYWRATPPEQIAEEILGRIARRTPVVRFLRFNEAGDFWSQECVDKLSRVAKRLKTAAGIVTYGFTARDDLDFSRAKFFVKGSGHDAGNHGRCRVIGPEEAVPDGYRLCPENCRTCDLCMDEAPVDIAFIERQPPAGLTP